MPFTLQQAITAARDRGYWFRRERVPDGVLARWLSEYQNALIAKCARRDRHYLRQSASIALSVSTANTPGVAGAGTSGGLPASVDANGNASVVESSAGALVELGLTSAEGAAVMVAERVVTSATSTTTTSTGAGRTVNEDVGRVVRITAGRGQGQVREITANTATQWTHAAWTTIPDTTSLMQVVAPALVTDETADVVTALPIESSQTGYLVRINASGVPYLDYTQPLTVSTEAGVALPSVLAVTGGTVRYTDGTADPLTITDADARFRRFHSPAVFLAGETLHLVGTSDEWSDVASIEVHYLPIAPDLTQRTDVFLLPDAAKGSVVAQAAAFMAARVSAMPDVKMDPTPLVAMGAEAERGYLASLSIGPRARTTTIREVW